MSVDCNVCNLADVVVLLQIQLSPKTAEPPTPVATAFTGWKILISEGAFSIEVSNRSYLKKLQSESQNSNLP